MPPYSFVNNWLAATSCSDSLICHSSRVCAKFLLEQNVDPHYDDTWYTADNQLCYCIDAYIYI